jgi:hypothetical protein
VTAGIQVRLRRKPIDSRFRSNDDPRAVFAL